MKKITYLLATLPLLTVACSSNNKINVLCPTGAPAFAFYDSLNNSNFVTSSNPNNIFASMTKASGTDVVVIDTISGIKAIRNGSPYKIAASITFGNFYLCSTGLDDNNQLDNDDVIVLFNKNSLPDVLFNFIYDESKFTNINYVDNVQEATVAYKTKSVIPSNSNNPIPVDYVLLAEPAVSAAGATVFSNIQEKYNDLTGGKKITQASIFVKSDSKKDISSFLANIKSAINEAINEPGLIKDKILDKYDEQMAIQVFGTNPKVVSNVTAKNNGMGLGFKYAIENISDINAFISLFGMEEINEEIIYQ